MMNEDEKLIIDIIKNLIQAHIQEVSENYLTLTLKKKTS